MNEVLICLWRKGACSEHPLKKPFKGSSPPRSGLLSSNKPATSEKNLGVLIHFDGMKTGLNSLRVLPKRRFNRLLIHVKSSLRKLFKDFSYKDIGQIVDTRESYTPVEQTVV
ncbi:hypothetical protein BGZ65_005245 [Modicella reniformis]|uniref:Uncharacterized protein n=1 Tax=Modicella reniformis TaxID=1440133 RepID=A0A9P6IY44_9FUNG|nr:hypothetical protein BGZ65_005245 [Modicella reniformis]